MICHVCGGSGLMQLPHVPSDSGGWIDWRYNHSGMECGACKGSGHLPHREPEPRDLEDEEEEPVGYEIGCVAHYYPAPGVAWIQLDAALSLGERVRIRGATTDFEFEVASLRIDDEPVDRAPPGEAGLRVPERVRVKDRLYRL